MTAPTNRRMIAYFVFFLGWSALASAAVQPEPARLEELVKAARSTDEAARLQAIQDLGTLGGAQVVPVLAELLQAESPTVRAYAARALGTVGEPAKSAAEGLIALLADPEQHVRRQALAAIAAIRPGPKVTVPLFVKLMHDADPGIRLRVMSAVAEAGSAAVPAMSEALKNEEAAYWACVILRDMGPEAAGAAPALVEKLKDRRPQIRREAVLALAAIGAADSAAKIAPLLKDEPSRTAATYALGALGRIPPNAEAIIRANIKSQDMLLSTTSLWALARVYPQDVALKRTAITQLVARLKDQDPFVRAAAARALSALPPSPEITGPIFEKALAEADETTTHYMLDALAGLGPKAVPRLIAALKHTSLRGQIAHILGQIGPPAAPATDALAKLVSDEDPNVGIEAAHALAKIGPAAKAAVPALIAALDYPESKARHAAAYALGAIGPAAAAAEPALLKVINGTDDSLSLISAWALIKISGVSAKTAAAVLPELITGLQSSSSESRQHAAETLGSLGALAKESAPELEHATKDADQRVRAAAAAALKAIRE